MGKSNRRGASLPELAVVVLVVVIAKAANGPKINQDYDKFKDQTTVSTATAFEEFGWPSVGVSASFTFPGRNLVAAPDSVVLTVRTVVQDHHFHFQADKASLKIIVLADDSRLSAPLDSYTGELRQEWVPGQTVPGREMDYVQIDSYIETMTFVLPAVDFAKVAYSRHSGMEIGDCKGDFGDDLLANFKELAMAGHLRRLSPAIQPSATQPSATQPSPESAAAANAYRKAKDACLAKLRATDEYKAALDAVNAAQQSRDAAPPDTLADAAQRLLQARTALHKLEDDALSADPEVIKAEQALNAGAAKAP